MMKPGELTEPHAQIVAATSSARRCATCHASQIEAGVFWPLVATSSTAKPWDQVARCLACHQQQLGENAHLAHSIAQSILLKAPATNSPGKDSHKDRHLPDHLAGTIQCARCHQEHRGRHHDLTAVTNEQCSACHATQFTNFAQGHPEFRDWPIERPQRIAFDHISHQTRYFPQKEQQFDCAVCHESGSHGVVTRTNSFERSCAACHRAGIEASCQTGLAVLRLPIVDSRVLQDAAGSLSDWPSAATGDMDGAVGPVAALLLMADADAASAMAALQPPFDLFDLDPQNPEDRKRAGDLAAALRTLVAELAEQGPLVVRQRLGQLLDHRADSPALDDLTAGLSHTLFEDLQRRWFRPHGTNPQDTRTQQQPSGDRVAPRRVDQTPTNDRPPRPSDRGSRIAPSDDLLAPDHDRHESDNDLLAPDDDLLAPSEDLLAPSDDLLAPNDDRLEGSDDLLAPGDDLLVPSETLRQPNDDLLAPESDGNVDTPSAESLGRVNPDSENSAANDTATGWERWRGTWRRDDETFTLVYYPQGHGDRFLKGLLELMARSSASEPVDAIRRTILAPDQLGQCTLCHVLPGEPTGGELPAGALWQATTASAMSGPQFTQFRHEPHLTQVELADCRACHQPAGSSTSNAEGDFLPIRKSMCARCHTAAGAGDGCTKCHRYHAAITSPWSLEQSAKANAGGSSDL